MTTIVSKAVSFEQEPTTALVVGGTSGIGSAITLELLQSGFEVVATSRNPDGQHDAREAAVAAGYSDRLRLIPFNLTDPNGVETMFTKVETDCRPLVHVAIVAAIDQPDTPLRNVPRKEWLRILDANLVSPALIAETAAPRIAAAGGGSVVFIGSSAATRGVQGYSVYAIAKSGLTNLVQHLAVEWGPAGVRFNCVAPSLIKTAFSQSMTVDNDITRRALAQYPTGRFGVPEDVAGMVGFLCTDKAAWISGQTFQVDGGMSSAYGCLRPMENLLAIGQS